ncbi:hypothetical protein M0813_15906 [Anaeramoeba flamelloides]|uniref:Ubiquitin-like domain-containing protein n=1 Tax=Anaeramoeba flamelloides TaxID=1746091 RepID=A0ABQ8Z325_9EUKA|nr:hypothetical protein M0813_15906 [Anaeramoeba flamelloides]
MKSFSGFGDFFLFQKENTQNFSDLLEELSNKFQIPINSLIVFSQYQILDQKSQTNLKTITQNDLYLFDRRRIDYATYSSYASAIRKSRTLKSFETIPKPVSKNLKLSMLQHQQFAKESYQYTQKCSQIQKYSLKNLQYLLSSINFYYNNYFKTIFNPKKIIKKKIIQTIQFENQILKKFLQINNIQIIEDCEKKITQIKKEIIHLSSGILRELQIMNKKQKQKQKKKYLETKFSKIKLQHQKLVQYLSKLEKNKIKFFEMFFLRGNILICTLFEMKQIYDNSITISKINSKLGTALEKNTIINQKNKEIFQPDPKYQKKINNNTSEKILTHKKLSSQKDLLFSSVTGMTTTANTVITNDQKNDFLDNSSTNNEYFEQYRELKKKLNHQKQNNQKKTEKIEKLIQQNKDLKQKNNKLNIQISQMYIQFQQQKNKSDDHLNILVEMLCEIDKSINPQNLKSKIKNHTYPLNSIISKLKENHLSNH